MSDDSAIEEPSAQTKFAKQPAWPANSSQLRLRVRIAATRQKARADSLVIASNDKRQTPHSSLQRGIAVGGAVCIASTARFVSAGNRAKPIAACGR